MRRALVVTRSAPVRREMVYGVYQRLKMFVQAIAQSADIVDCLFLLPRDATLSKDETEAFESRLRATWAANIEVRLAYSLEPSEQKLSSLDLYIWPFLGLNHWPGYSEVRNPETADAIRKSLRPDHEMLFAHRLAVMSVVAGRLANDVLPPVFFDLDDIEHLAFSRRLLHSPGWPMERLRVLQTAILMLAERRCVRRAAFTSVCSDGDRQYLARLYGSSQVSVVPNGVSATARVSAATGKILLFVGTYNYAPNVVAAEILLHQVWPLVKRAHPDAELWLVGQSPEQIPGFGKPHDGVRFLGFVEDLDPIYASAAAVCCPLRSGGGTRIKIIEAACHGRAIVSTHVGAEGLDFIPGEEILLADEVPDISALCIDLLARTASADQIGQRAWLRARDTYSREAIVQRLLALFRATTEARSVQGGRNLSW